jgi:ribose 1,5-bisphosphokinase PhnN
MEWKNRMVKELVGVEEEVLQKRIREREREKGDELQ